MRRGFWVFFTLFGAHALAAVTLVSGGQPKAAVILPDRALPVQKLAAEELIYHVRKATGVTLPLYPESKAPREGDHVYIGPCRRTAAAGIDPGKLAPAEFRILSRENELFICGRDNDRGPVGSTFSAVWHGTLWGVYDLLRRELGIRWLWPGELGEYIPSRGEIVLNGLDRSRKPPLRHTSFMGLKYRKYLDRFAFRETVPFLEAQKRFVLRHRVGAVEPMRAGHNFTDYWKKYGKKHPEYFAFIPPGGRKPLPGNEDGKCIALCLSSPALHRRIVEDHFAGKKPGVNRISLTLNDTPILCRCAGCRSWDEKDPAFETSSYWNGSRTLTSATRFSVAFTGWGEDAKISVERNPSLSDRFCRFVNAVLKVAREKEPGIQAIGFAYANYTDAPVRAKISDMLLVHVASLWFPYTDRMSQKCRKQLLNWKAAGVKEFLFRPNLTHAGANLPVFYAREFAADLRFAAQNGMIGISLDSLLGAYAAQGPTLYTILRMMDDPSDTADRILDEYYSCFGPVKEDIRAYFGFWEEHSRKLKEYDMKKICSEEALNGRVGGTFKNYVLISHRLFSLKDFKDAGKILAGAWKKSGSDPLTRRRVEFLQKGLRDAELTVRTRLAQVEMQKNPTPENRRAFMESIQNLYRYRVKIAPDFTANHAYFFMRETHGSKWPMPKKKAPADHAKNASPRETK